MAGLKSNYPFAWEHGKHTDIFIAGMQKNKLPPLEILNWLFRYESESGKLFRIRESSGKLCEPEREIVAADSGGYLVVCITDSSGLEKTIKVHQVIYYMASGIEPLFIIDHRDGNPLNNRFSNLRLTTDSGNSRNSKMRSDNTSGITGVSWYKPNSKWRARAHDSTGKFKHLGYFNDIESAANVVKAHYTNPSNGYTERHGV